jgi:photosystem II stability/assembly factor-like uncharacterized protein
MLRLIALGTFLLVFANLAVAQAPKKSAVKSAAPAKAAKAEPKFKAIWEPVPFNQDIGLNSIACTGPETCWVAGDKSTILFTTDGGTTWQAQLGGDPAATDEDLAHIVFLDAQHGWAMTDRNRIMGTSDGSTWAELSTASGTSKGLSFATPRVGFVSDNHDSQTESHLNRTQDGGKTWTRGEACTLQAVVDGLSRNIGCMPNEIKFVSPTTGFMGGAAVLNMAVSMAAFSKTTDGGAKWVHSVIPATEHQIDSIVFWSEKDGLALLASGKTFWTADAGATWTGSVSSPSWRSYYASGEGKIVVGINQNGRQAGYSFNGGRNFTSRPLGLPAMAADVTFPDARHGYLVGQHGMVYRYRIVPIDYSSQGMIAAAAAPGQ